MEGIRKLSKKYYLRQIVACVMACYMMFGVPLQVAMATPNPAPGTLPGNILAGSTNNAASNTIGSTMTVTSDPGQTLVNWDNFDIGSGATVDFTQNGGWVLNNVTPAGSGPGFATGINGTLTAQMCGLIVQNQNGVVMGPQALIQAQSFAALGLTMDTTDFLNDNFSDFGMVPGTAKGNVRTKAGARIEVDEMLALIGKNVFHMGRIITKQEDALIIMGAGDTVVIGEENSHVFVRANGDVAAGTSRVEYDGTLNTNPANGKVDMVLGAGDVMVTAAIEDIETLRVEAVHTAVIDAPISVKAVAASDAVAGVSIISGSDLKIDEDIEATATGNGVDDAIATIELKSTGGKVTVISGGKDGTLVKAEAKDGKNNTAEVSIEADDDARVLGPDRVQVIAEAHNATNKNKATVDIKGDNVVVTADDSGSSHEEAEVKALAHDGDENVAKIDIEATDGDVRIRGADENTSPSELVLIKADAEDGSRNRADILIKASGDVEVLANDQGVKIEAKAHHGNSPAVLNEANIEITGHGVRIIAENAGSGDDDAVVKAWAHDGITNRANIAITANGEGSDADVKIESQRTKGDEAAVLALAEDGKTNEAAVDIDAADDVRIKSNDDDAVVKAEAKNELDEDDVEDGGIRGLRNIASVDITAGDEVEIKATTESDADATVEALAYNKIDLDNGEGDESFDTVEDLFNKATVDITGESVEVRAENGAEAYVKAKAYNEIKLDPAIPMLVAAAAEQAVRMDPVVDLTVKDLRNVATVDMTATDGTVEIKGRSCGKAGVEAMAYNDIEVDIDNRDTDVTVNLTLDNLDNTAKVTIDAHGELEGGEQVEIDGESSGDAWVLAEAYNELEFDQSSGYRRHIGCGRYRYVKGKYGATLNFEATRLRNTAVVDISGETENVEVEATSKNSEALVEALAYNEFDIDFREAESSTGNLSFDRLKNIAEIYMYSGDDVEVTAQDGAEAWISARAWNDLDADDEADGEITGNNIENIATVDIDVDEDVEVDADCHGECSEAYIEAVAHNEGDLSEEPECGDELPSNMKNTATVDITAGDDVEVTGEDCGAARIEAYTGYGMENTSKVKIDAGDDVLVEGDNGDAEILAIAEYGVDNVAEIDIDAGGTVEVTDEGQGGGNTAAIEAIAEYALNSNVADIDIVANNVLVLANNGGSAKIMAMAAHSALPECEQGDKSNKANVEIYTFAVEETCEKPQDPKGQEVFDECEGEKHNGDVLVRAENGSDASIKAVTYGDDNHSSNDSDVLICAEGLVKVKADTHRRGDASAEIKSLAHFGRTNDAYLGIGAMEGIEVISKSNGDASIAAKAFNGECTPAYSNKAELVACTMGHVQVKGMGGSYDDKMAEIVSEAYGGVHNDAYTGVKAVGPVEVIGKDYCGRGGGQARISSEAHADLPPCLREQSTATANTHVFSLDDGVLVKAYRGDAEISSSASGAYHNDAWTAVCAKDDILVEADGCHASIKAEAEGFKPDQCDGSKQPDGPDGRERRAPTTANAKTTVVSHEGGVKVYAGSKGTTAEIRSEARNAELVTAYTGVSAAGIPPMREPVPCDSVEVLSKPQGDGHGHGGISVISDGGYASIESRANGGDRNKADTVVCTPGLVRVESHGDRSVAKIKSWAKDGDLNKATTQVYAGAVKVRVDSLYHGSGIGAWAEGDDWVHVGSHFTWYAEDGRKVRKDGGSKLIIDTYENRQDCPDCPPCPDCPCKEDVEILAAPLYRPINPDPVDCPLLVRAATNELLGAGEAEAMDILMENALALNPDINPCEACAQLINSAAVLADAGGARFAALQAVVGEVAPADAPFTPETGALIASAMADNAGSAEAPQYALAEEYVDAFVDYIAAASELGIPVEDGEALAMEKYGAPLTEAGNENLGAYISARIATLGG